MKQKIQWFVDMATSADTMQVIKITAGGANIMKRTAPFWSAYKYFKLGPVKIRFVPASTLPVDPTGLSYEAGEQFVNPTDMFNPGLVRITNGEDFMDDSTLPDLSEDLADAMYYNMMLDRRWYKFQLQRGFSRVASPLFWSIGQIRQDLFPGATVNMPQSVGDMTNPQVNGAVTSGYLTGQGVDFSEARAMFSPYALYQTGGKQRMGWMPTDAFVKSVPLDDSMAVYPSATSFINTPPEVDLMKIILPRAKKTLFYYRVYVEETVYFKDPVTIGFNAYGMMDRFIRPDVKSMLPAEQFYGPTGLYPDRGE